MNKKLIAANGKIVRHAGIVYKIRASALGKWTLAQAEPFKGGETINLVKTRSNVSKQLRNAINLGLVS